MDGTPDSAVYFCFSYYTFALPTVQRRVAKAVIRLAYTLNQISRLGFDRRATELIRTALHFVTEA